MKKGLLMTIEVNLVDRTFRHHPKCSVAGRSSQHIKWRRDEFDSRLATVITDSSINLSDTPVNVRKSESIAWTLESSAIQPNVISFLGKRGNDYRRIFTHNASILEKYSHARFVPGGGVWIGGSHAGGLIDIHSKSRLVSMISSKKLRSPLHRFRLAAAIQTKSQSKKFDVSIGSSRVESWNFLESHAFNIAIENYVDDFYFTEKLLNCFATGTVPIYRGARQIGDFFNSAGIIQFTTLKELSTILKNLDMVEYERRMEALQDNFTRVQKFLTIEDFIYQNYKEDICN
jgi:hypothetical protein